MRKPLRHDPVHESRLEFILLADAIVAPPEIERSPTVLEQC